MHFEREIFWTSEGGAGCAVHALVMDLSKQSELYKFCSRPPQKLKLPTSQKKLLKKGTTSLKPSLPQQIVV